MGNRRRGGQQRGYPRAHGPIESLEVRDWDAVLTTVLTGAFLTTRATLPQMRQRGWGRIVNIAGMSIQSGAAGRAPVVAAKADSSA